MRTGMEPHGAGCGRASVGVGSPGEGVWSRRDRAPARARPDRRGRGMRQAGTTPAPAAAVVRAADDRRSRRAVRAWRAGAARAVLQGRPGAVPADTIRPPRAQAGARAAALRRRPRSAARLRPHLSHLRSQRGAWAEAPRGRPPGSGGDLHNHLHEPEQHLAPLARLELPQRLRSCPRGEDGRADDTLGGSIMIHGGSGSIGCMAVGDEAAEDLFILTADAGWDRGLIVVSPVDFRRTDLPADYRASTPWVNDLYAWIRAELDTLPLAPPPAASVASGAP